MGKKGKKKSNNIQKEKRGSSGSHDSNPPEEVVDNGVSVVKERKYCAHIDKLDLKKFTAAIASSEPLRCKDCREGAIDRRETKGRSKHGKKKATVIGRKESNPKRVWVCLECGHFACGGVGLPTTPQTHVSRHAKQLRHHCVIQFENPHLCWCFPCNSLIPVGKMEQDGDQKDVLLEAMKLIKGRPSEGEGASMDVEDVWFRSGSVLGEYRSEGSKSGSVNGRSGYAVHGLTNLGNTCFFNSVTQNLLGIDQLRDYFMNLDHSVGPLSKALKNLVNETSSGANSKNRVTPKELFGSICVKAPQFRGFQQQDSHELLRYLLDGLCTEELNVRKLVNPVDGEDTSNPGSTFVDAVFGGQLSSTVSCMECRHSSVVYEPFLDLSLPVPTKKPSREKDRLISRSKRTKLPLNKEGKKAGKILGKGKRGAFSLLSEPLTGAAPVFSEPLTGTSPVLSEPLTSQTESNNSSCLAPSALPLKDKTLASSDDFSWMDYVEQDTTSDVLDSVSSHCDTSIIQGSESQEISGNNDVLQDFSEEQSKACSQNAAQEPNVEVPERDSIENDLPLQVQASEIILLPYKEESLTAEEMVSKESEASASAVNFGQDISEFEGLGDMFNEPEVVSVSTTVSLSGDTNFHGKEVAETGFLPGNSSESDPDEVDDTDAPVSVDSCLAYFIKPELLSGEHAWHCENCSKVLHRQKVEVQEDKLITTVNDLSDVDAESRSLDDDSLESDIVFTTAAESLVACTEKLDASNQNHINDEIIPLDEKISSLPSASSLEASCTKLSQRDSGLPDSNNAPKEVSSCMDHCERGSQPKIGDQTSESCNMNEQGSIESNVDRVQYMDYQLNPRKHKSDDKKEAESTKVMRDATKRILINKAPEILTIHLKRFSQDARGRLSKLSGHVAFRDTIDLSPYVDLRSNENNNYHYRLIGVVEHSGRTMRQGHYVAYVRCKTNKGKTDSDSGEATWFYVSDAYVREVSLAEVLHCEAYILFYGRV